MQKLWIMSGSLLTGILSAWAAMAHPGHALDHLAALLASSPVAWIVLAALGFLALRRLATRVGTRPPA